MKGGFTIFKVGIKMGRSGPERSLTLMSRTKRLGLPVSITFKGTRSVTLFERGMYNFERQQNEEARVFIADLTTSIERSEKGDIIQYFETGDFKCSMG